MTMKVTDVRAKVKTIKQLAGPDGDTELAHSMEDDLYEAVLRAIVADPSNAVALAKAALKTRDMEFSRHCS